MTNIKGKKAVEVEIKSDGDLFHELLRNKPHHLSNLTPIIDACNLHDGEWGTVGSVISWHYFHGDLLELYKTLDIIVHVDKKGKNDLVTWTMEYEKLNENIPDPDGVLEMFKNITKHIEAEHTKA